jgi:hypothetical protein
MPWATSESTGLPEIPMASNHPWIMEPGTHRAHIMISPLTEESSLNEDLIDDITNKNRTNKRKHHTRTLWTINWFGIHTFI